jgi:predicted nucleotidyltransferase
MLSQIESFVQEIVRLYSPKKVILFGSQARGTATIDSDVDLLILMDYEGFGARKGAEILARINPKFAVDLLVRRPADIEQALNSRDFFIQEVYAEGTVLYDAADA